MLPDGPVRNLLAEFGVALAVTTLQAEIFRERRGGHCRLTCRNNNAKKTTVRNNWAEPPGEPPIPACAAAHAAWYRLQHQLDWYEHKSQHCQDMYKRLKIVQVALAVLIPMTSLLPSDAAKWASSIAGVLIAVPEALQQINQYATL